LYTRYRDEYYTFHNRRINWKRIEKSKNSKWENIWLDEWIIIGLFISRSCSRRWNQNIFKKIDLRLNWRIRRIRNIGRSSINLRSRIGVLSWGLESRRLRISCLRSLSLRITTRKSRGGCTWTTKNKIFTFYCR